MENLAHWRYFFACKQIRVNNSNHFCMSSFSNLYKAFPLQYAGPFNSRRLWRLLLASPVKAAAIAGPPKRTSWAWLARCYWCSKKQNISKRKTDILESQRAIFMIQQLWIGQKEKKNKPRKGNYTCPLSISSRKTRRSPLPLPHVKAKPSAPRSRILIK